MSPSKGIIYLDNAATTRESPQSIQTVAKVSNTDYGNPSSSHLLGRRARALLEKYRSSIAKCLGITHPSTQLIFTSGATESNNLALRGRVAHCKTKAKSKPHVICTNVEHASVHVTLHDMKQHGLIDLTELPVDKHGVLGTALLAKAIRPNTVLVAVILANNEIGTIQDYRAIVNTCRRHPNVHIHLDATQMVGRYLLNFHRMGADSISFSGHKFCGPRGIGGLYLRDPSSVDTVVTGGSQEHNLRAGTENVAAIAGMSVALSQSLAGIEKKMERVQQMRDDLQRKFERAFPGQVVVNGLRVRGGNPSWATRLYNILSLSFPFANGNDVVERLRDQGVCISVGSACSKKSGSKVLKAIGLSDALQQGTLRISLGHDTTPLEIDQAFDRIRSVLLKS